MSHWQSRVDQDTHFSQACNGQREKPRWCYVGFIAHGFAVDPLSHWPHPHNRSTQDCHLFCSKTEAERHGRIHERHTTDIVTVASDRVSDRTLRHLYSFWRLLRNNWFLHGKRSGRRSISPANIRKGKRRAEKRGTSGVRQNLGGHDLGCEV